MSNPAIPFVFTTPEFSGSIDNLQDEVSRGSIRAVDLDFASLTDEFKCHIAQADAIDLDEIGLFVSTVSRLVATKAGALVPRPETDSSHDAAANTRGLALERLDIEVAVAALCDRQGLEVYPGESRQADFPRVREPRPPVELARAWNELHAREATDRVRVTTPPFVRLEVAISRLIGRIKSASHLSFRSLIKGVNRQDAVIHFLAVLELVRRRQIIARQRGLFEEISLEQLTRMADDDVRAG